MSDPLDDVPFINLDLLPDGERTKGDSINLCLLALSSFASNFEKALGLFDYVRKVPYHSPAWSCLVAQQAMFMAWNFGDALENIAQSFNSARTLKTALGKKAFKPVVGTFGASFPDLEEMRNTGAHPVEEYFTPLSSKNSPLRNRTFLVMASVEGRDLVFTRNRRILRFDVSKASFEKIIKVKCAAYLVMAAADEKLRNHAQSASQQHSGPVDGT